MAEAQAAGKMELLTMRADKTLLLKQILHGSFWFYFGHGKASVTNLNKDARI